MGDIELLVIFVIGNSTKLQKLILEGEFSWATKFTLRVKGTGHTLDSLKSTMEPEDCSLCRLGYGSAQQ
jgi:hypothetical protein